MFMVGFTFWFVYFFSGLFIFFLVCLFFSGWFVYVFFFAKQGTALSNLKF